MSITEQIKTLVIFEIEGEFITNVYRVPCKTFCEIPNIEALINYVKCTPGKLYYFDEEDDLVSLKDNDFNTFKNIVMSKTFSNNEVQILLCNEPLKNTMKNKSEFNKVIAEFNNTKYWEDSIIASPIDDESSSSGERKLKIKKHKVMTKFSAEFKSELNYLSGSEIIDGQTIIKKWKIKNIGMKKWKKNSLKVVLLHSDHRDWITYQLNENAICYADQKTNLEMEITINGKWLEEKLSPVDSQRIDFKWLVYIDKLLSSEHHDFKNYILTTLDLSIIVKKRTFEIPETINMSSPLQAGTSDSSIEKVEHDYSFVNYVSNKKKISNSCESIEVDKELNKPRLEKFETQYPSGSFLPTPSVSLTSNQFKNASKHVEMDGELDLPDCPGNDDFQISDFNRPDTILSIQSNSSTKEPDMRVNSNQHIFNTEGVDFHMSFNNEDQEGMIVVERSQLEAKGDDIKNDDCDVDLDNKDGVCGNQVSIEIESVNHDKNNDSPADVVMAEKEAENIIQPNALLEDMIQKNLHSMESSVTNTHKNDSQPAEKTEEAEKSNETNKQSTPEHNGFTDSTNCNYPGFQQNIINVAQKTGLAAAQSVCQMLGLPMSAIPPPPTPPIPPPPPHCPIYQAGLIMPPIILGQPFGNMHSQASQQNRNFQHCNETEAKTIKHLTLLREMGFGDDEKLLRLLKKFDNNLSDVIQDLIDQ